MRSRGMRYAAEGAVLLAHAGSGVGPYPVLAGGVPHETGARITRAATAERSRKGPFATGAGVRYMGDLTPLPLVSQG
jgi:hypothetical protein